MPPTKVIYKSVLGGEAAADSQDEDHDVIFTIASDDDDDGDDDYGDGEQDNDRGRAPFEMESAPPMEQSSYSFSDDDFSEQLFDWKYPWLPSLTVTAAFTAPVLLGNAWMFYDLMGAWFFATPFALHLVLALCAARHFVSGRLTALNSPASRIFTSVASL